MIVVERLLAGRSGLFSVHLARSGKHWCEDARESEISPILEKQIGMSIQESSVTLFPGLTVTREDTVLDLGCGGGITCARVGSVGSSVIAVDVDDENVKRTETVMKDIPARSFRAIRSDCDPIPLDDETATVVIAQEVLEHVPDPHRFVLEMARVGASEARYLITVPDPISEKVIAQFAGPAYTQPPHHIHVFDRSQIESVLADAGLDIVARSFVGFYESLWWIFNVASSPGHSGDWPSGRGKPNDGASCSQLVRLWERTWAEFGMTAGFEIIQSMLDRHLPKSQVYVARKRTLADSVSTSKSRGELLQDDNERLKWENECLIQQNAALLKGLQRLHCSRSWRYMSPLRKSKQAILRVLGFAGFYRNQ